MPKAPLVRLSTQIFDTPLAIQTSKLEVILRAIGPRLHADQAAIESLVGAHLLPTRPIRAYDEWDEEDDYSSNQRKKPYSQTAEGVAIIPIHGVLMKKGGWMTSLSGCASYEGISKATTAAMDDPSVRAVLFDIDSPGGTTHGCFECADLIYSYRGNGKPTLAVANDLAASAAYALASSADRVFVTRTGGVGSIGVFCLHLDQSAADAQAGVKYTYVYAGDHKVDGNPHESLSKSAKSTIQSEVDRQYDLFVSTVARNRGVKPERVVGTKADVLFSPSAIPLLADSVASYAEALEDLTSKVVGGSVTIPVSTRSNNRAAMVTSLSGDKDNMADTKDKDLETLRKEAADSAKALADAEAAVATATVIGSSTITAEAIAAGVAAIVSYKPTHKVLIPAAKPAATSNDPCDDPDDPDMNADDYEMVDGKKVKKSKPVMKSADTGESTEGSQANMPIDTAPVIPAASAPVFTVEMATEIADLCAMVGRDNLAAAFIRAKTPVAEVRKALIDARAEDSSKSQVAGHFGVVSTDGVDQTEKLVVALVASSGGKLSRSQAYEQVLTAHPEFYEQAKEDKAQAMLTPASRSRYMALMKAKMPSMGLSAGA